MQKLFRAGFAGKDSDPLQVALLFRFVCLSDEDGRVVQSVREDAGIAEIKQQFDAQVLREMLSNLGPVIHVEETI